MTSGDAASEQGLRAMTARISDASCERGDRVAPSRAVLRELAVYLVQGLEERARRFSCGIDDAGS